MIEAALAVDGPSAILESGAGEVSAWLREIKHIPRLRGKTRNGLQCIFQASVDDYLAACERLGQPPEKPFPTSA